MIILLLIGSMNISQAQQVLTKGSGIWYFSGHPALKGDTMRVFYHRPEGQVKHMPVLFVMHGIKRNADTYRDNWVDLSKKKKVLVLVPEFTTKAFPGSRAYNNGNIRSKDKQPVPDSLWSFSLLDPIFDAVIAEIGGKQKGYDLFGHSAGAQFVHRFFLMNPSSKTKRVVAANAGTYTMFEHQIDYPYGLKGIHYTDEQLKTVLQKQLVIQLGEADTDPHHRYLNTGKSAMRQGAYRLERGQHFYQQAREAAQRLDVPFNWTLRTVSGVGHDNGKMAQDIAEYLYP